MNVILLFKNIHLCTINDCGINQDVRYKLDIFSPQISNPQAEWDIKPQLSKPVVVDPLSVVIRSAINDVPAFFPPLGVASVARSLQHDHKGRCR